MPHWLVILVWSLASSICTIAGTAVVIFFLIRGSRRD
jgi:hypothetical protein